VVKIILLFLLSRLFFLAIAVIAPRFIPADPGYLGSQVAAGEPSWIWVWANFDGRHYIDIATKGYTGSNFAFFPLYPLLINLVSHLGLSPIYAGLLISNLALVLSLYFLTKITSTDKTESLVLLLFFPLSFFFSSVYGDSIFLLFTLAGFYFAKSGRWLVSAGFAFLATLTRFTGVALIPALALEWWLQNKGKKINWRALIAPVGSLLGFSAYALYLQLGFANWRLFQTSMSAWKFERFTLLPVVIYRYLRIFFSVSPSLLVYWVAVLEFVCFFLYLTLAVYVAKRIRLSYGLFMATLLLIRTVNGTLAGTPRYLLHLFPAFIGLALLLHRHPKLRLIYYPISLVLAAILTALFVRGYFIS